MRQIDVLFIKGWAGFLAIADPDVLSHMGSGGTKYYDDLGLDLIGMVNDKFIPVGGHIVLFASHAADADKLASKIKERFGYEDLLQQKLSPQQISMMEDSDAVSEIRVDIDESGSRKLTLGGTMRVLVKVR